MADSEPRQSESHLVAPDRSRHGVTVSVSWHGADPKSVTALSGHTAYSLSQPIHVFCLYQEVNVYSPLEENYKCIHTWEKLWTSSSPSFEIKNQILFY